MKLKRRNHHIPPLQMAAMPDLIFTILFFFMIATHMRKTVPTVEYDMPQGSSLQKVTREADVIDIFIGKNRLTGEYEVQGLPATRGTSQTTLPACRVAMLHADRDAPMAVINKVKKELREAMILKINYCANETISEPSQSHRQ